MKRHIVVCIISCCVLLSGLLSIASSPRDTRQTLLSFAGRQKAIMEAERRAAVAKAKRYNWPLRAVTPEGIIIELQGLTHGRPLYYATHNSEAANTIATDKVRPEGLLGYILTGEAQSIAMWDGGAVRTDHHEFGGRARQLDSGADITDHTTHVAGTLIAAGVVDDAKGMAYKAMLHTYNWTNDLAEMAVAAAGGVLLSNHSYGPKAGWIYNLFNDQRWAWFGDPAISEIEDYQFGYYMERARQWDELAYQAPEYLIVATAGNDRSEYGPVAGTRHWVLQGSEWVLSTTEREPDGGNEGYDSINGFAVAKNVLTVGAVQALPWPYASPSDVRMTNFSCWGPADDGRIKPDVVADGVYIFSTSASAADAYETRSGTSSAAPSVTGSIALLREHHENLNGTEPILASTLKALVIHTARESGPAPGPDYQFGWGLMNTASAVALMSQDFDAGGNTFIREIKLSNGAAHEFQIQADGKQPLKVTMVWTDPPGPSLAPALDSGTQILANDVDLRVIGPTSGGSSQTHTPWVLDPRNPSAAAQTGDNMRDNMEQVYIEKPRAGEYTVRLSHKSSLQNGSQIVSVVHSGTVSPSIVAPPAPILTYPASGTTIDADSLTLKWSKTAGASSYTLQIAYDGQFGSLFLREEDIRTTRYSLEQLPANTTLYWRLMARNAGGESPFSQPGHFHIGSSGVPVVWEKISTPEVDYSINAIKVNKKGYIFASLDLWHTMPNYMEIMGTYRSMDDGLTWQKVYRGFDRYNLDSKGNLYGISGNVLNMGETGEENNEIFYLPSISAQDMFITEQDHFFVIAYYGKLYHSTDNGQTWNHLGDVPLPAGINTQRIKVFDGSVYVTTWGAGVFCSADSGQSWTCITSGSGINYVYTIERSQNGTLLLGTLAGLYTSPVNPIEWERKWDGDIATSKIIDIVVGRRGVIYANSYGCQGPGDGVFISVDHGETWVTVNSGLQQLSTRSLCLGPDGDPYIGIGTGNPLDLGAIYRGSRQRALEYMGKKTGIATPGPVELTVPDDNAHLNSLEVLLEWKSVLQASLYHVQLAASPDFLLPLYDQETADTQIPVQYFGSGTSYYWRVRALNAIGDGPWSDVRRFTTSPTAPVERIESQIPKSFALYQNYPNPFNPITTIAFDLPKSCHLSLKVYDILGREVAPLVSKHLPAGRYEAVWDATGLPSGLYFYKLESNGFIEIKKIILQK